MDKLQIDTTYFSIKLGKLNHTFMKKQVNVYPHVVEGIWNKLFSRDIRIFIVSSFIIRSLLSNLKRGKIN